MKCNKRLVLFSLALILLLAVPFNLAEAKSPERNIKVWINDFYVMSDVHPFVENSRTYVPVRFIAEELGYKVEWDGKEEMVTISKDEVNMYLRIDSDEVYVNEDVQHLDAPARLRESRTFVPFRAVAELFGAKVEYDKDHKIAIIGSDFNPEEYYPLKYYFKNNNPFITNSKANFVDYIVRYSDGKLFELKSDLEIFKLIDEEGKNFKEVEFDREVEEDKQLYDKHYVAPIEKDPFVGSWYGTSKVVGTTEYYDQYTYLEKVDDNKYLYKKRSLKPNGSELITESYATYDGKDLLIKKNSHKTTKATGDFTYSWYSTGADLKVENFDYMYDISDNKIFLRKY